MFIPIGDSWDITSHLERAHANIAVSGYHFGGVVVVYSDLVARRGAEVDIVHRVGSLVAHHVPVSQADGPYEEADPVLPGEALDLGNLADVIAGDLDMAVEVVVGRIWVNIVAQVVQSYPVGPEVREHALHGADALAEVGVVEELGVREISPDERVNLIVPVIAKIVHLGNTDDQLLSSVSEAGDLHEGVVQEE
jgi:hypothetical protein